MIVVDTSNYPSYIGIGLKFLGTRPLGKTVRVALFILKSIPSSVLLALSRALSDLSGALSDQSQALSDLTEAEYDDEYNYQEHE